MVHQVGRGNTSTMRTAKVRDVTFLSKKSSDTKLDSILESIRKTVDKENYDWKVARITTDGKVNFE